MVIEWQDQPGTEKARAAQIVRIVDALQIEHLEGYDITETDDGSALLHLAVVVPITRAQAVAILTPNDLQLLRAGDVVEWPASLVHEYRRQYDAKMRLPHPPLLIHPDHAEQLWTAANGPLPEGKN